MNRIPFDPYDFFGYLASGLLVVVGMDRVFGFPQIIGEDLKTVDMALLLLVVYIAGQLVATPAKALLEDFVVEKLLGRPNVNLFRKKRPWIRRLLFPGFYRPLPEAIRVKVLAKAEGEGVSGTGEGLFLHVRYDARMVGNEKLMARLDGFLNKYGFSRNLAFTSGLVAVALLTKYRFTPDPEFLRYGWTALVGAVLLFYRYLKFFRQYSYEMFNIYAGLRSPEATSLKG